MSPRHGAVEELHQMSRLALLGEQLEKTSNVPALLSRQNRFQMLFHLPNSAGMARQPRLFTVKR